jgi:hypothetical protein
MRIPCCITALVLCGATAFARIGETEAQIEKRYGKRANQSSRLSIDNLSKAGWSLGWVSALDLKGRTIWIVDAHRDDGKRFIVRAEEKLTAFLELESAILAAARSHYPAAPDLMGAGVEIDRK